MGDGNYLRCGRRTPDDFLSPAAFQIALKDDGGRNLVDKRLVLPRLLLQASVYHGTVGQHRREPFVDILDGQLRLSLSPSIDELLHPSQVLAGLPIGLDGFPDNDALDGFPRNIGHKIVVQL